MPRLNVNRTQHLQYLGPGLRAVDHATKARWANDAAAAAPDCPGYATVRRTQARRHQTAADRLGEENMRTHG